MIIQAALTEFRKRYSLSVTSEKYPQMTVNVFWGLALIPLPNIPARQKFLQYHDLHHLVTGYGISRIGEGKVSAWELGTGTFWHFPVLAFMNLIAFSTGMLLSPHEMWAAFLCGKRSQNLYSRKMRERLCWTTSTLEETRHAILGSKPERPPQLHVRAEFGLYCALASLTHVALATIALPVLVFREIRKRLK